MSYYDLQARKDSKKCPIGDSILKVIDEVCFFGLSSNNQKEVYGNLQN